MDHSERIDDDLPMKNGDFPPGDVQSPKGKRNFFCGFAMFDMRCSWDFSLTTVKGSGDLSNE